MAKPKKWQCTVCGHMEEGAAPPRNCTKCGVGSEKFVQYK